MALKSSRTTFHSEFEQSRHRSSTSSFRKSSVFTFPSNSIQDISRSIGLQLTTGARLASLFAHLLPLTLPRHEYKRDALYSWPIHWLQPLFMYPTFLTISWSHQESKPGWCSVFQASSLLFFYAHKLHRLATCGHVENTALFWNNSSHPLSCESPMATLLAIKRTVRVDNYIIV